MSASAVLVPTDTYPAYHARYTPAYCLLAAPIGPYSVRLRFPDEKECVFSRKSGKPAKGFEVAFRGWYLPKGTLKMLAEAALQDDQSRVRPNVAKQITQALLDRCPLGGKYWLGFKEVTVALREQRYRLDVVWMETCKPYRLVGAETKSCRADFAADEKWSVCEGLVHAFYLVAPSGVIAPMELGAGTGLLEWDGLELRLVREAEVKPTLLPEIQAAVCRGLVLAATRAGG